MAAGSQQDSLAPGYAIHAMFHQPALAWSPSQWRKQYQRHSAMYAFKNVSGKRLHRNPEKSYASGKTAVVDFTIETLSFTRQSQGLTDRAPGREKQFIACLWTGPVASSPMIALLSYKTGARPDDPSDTTLKIQGSCLRHPSGWPVQFVARHGN